MRPNEHPISRLQQKIWDGSLPLEIRLSRGECRTYEDSDSYLVQAPRLSYLPFLLSRLHAFFRPYLIDPDAGAPHDGWFSYEGVPLKWHFPIGLLYDIYAGDEPASAEDEPQSSKLKSSRAEWDPRSREDDPSQTRQEKAAELSSRDTSGATDLSEDSQDGDTLPWSITVHFTDWPIEHLPKLSPEGSVLLDAFRNQLKESSFTRHSTNKPIFGLSYEDSTGLWAAVQQHDLPAFQPINEKLLHPPGIPLKAVPLRLYLPHMPDSADPAEDDEAAAEKPGGAGTLRVVQAPVTPQINTGSSRQTPQTLGTALNSLLPSLFPSRRSPLLALPVLHGAVVPLSANLEELGQAASYADGWLHIAIKMMG